MNQPASTPAKPKIDWPAFYKTLDLCSVQLPQFSPGDPADLGELRRLLTLIQNNRDRATRILNGCLQKLGEAEHARDLAKTTLRVQQVTFQNDPEVQSLRTAAERKQAVDELCVPIVVQVGFLLARVSELKVARVAVEATLKSLETAKETINAIHRQTVAELEKLHRV